MTTADSHPAHFTKGENHDSSTRLAREFAAQIALYEQHRRSMFPIATVQASSGATEPLGPAEQRLLWLLADGKPRTLKAISEELHLEQSTVNRQANAALAHGVVRRSRQGGEAYTFTATKHGAERLETTLAGLFASYHQTFNRMGEADSQEFIRLLEKFVSTFTDAAPVT